MVSYLPQFLFKTTGNTLADPMKTHLKTVLAALLSSCCLSNVYADAHQGEIASFAELIPLVALINNPTATIIVMDDDDTLTTMPCSQSPRLETCQYLGGAAWYAWQSELLEKYQKQGQISDYLVAKSKQELFEISSLLFAMSNMSYTEQDVPKVLNKLSAKGTRLMVETARSDSDLTSTIRQFSALKSGNSDFMSTIQNSAPVFPEGNIPSLASPFNACNIPGSTPISYRQGAMYLAGQNKGVMLKCLLNHYQDSSVAAGDALPIKHIIFMDDTLQNVKDVYHAFKDNKQYRVHALHYTALAKHQSDFTSGPFSDALQKQANQRWTAIKDVLQSNLLLPSVSEK